MKEKLVQMEDAAEFIDKFFKYVKKAKKEMTDEEFADFVFYVWQNNKSKMHNGFIVSEFKEIDWNNVSKTKVKKIGESLIAASKVPENGNELYFIIEAVSFVLKKKAYDFLISVIKGDYDLIIRAIAMQRLSIVAKQRFHIGLHKDVGYWKEEDMRYDLLEEWIDGGMKDGKLPNPPKCDDALFSPASKLETYAAKLNKKLEKYQDPEFWTYDNYLIIPETKQVENLKKKYNLSGSYLEFLSRFSPENVSVSKGVYEVSIYGVSDLEERQIGYAVDENGKPLDGWNKNYLVIADKDSDPYCIDISEEKTNVYYAEHGTGEWNFEKVYASFEAFLAYLAK